MLGDISDQSKNNVIWNRAFCLLRDTEPNQEVYFDSMCLNLNTLRNIINHSNHTEFCVVYFHIDSVTAKERVRKALANNENSSNTDISIIKGGREVHLIDDMDSRRMSAKEHIFKFCYDNNIKIIEVNKEVRE